MLFVNCFLCNFSLIFIFFFYCIYLKQTKTKTKTKTLFLRTYIIQSSIRVAKKVRPCLPQVYTNDLRDQVAPPEFESHKYAVPQPLYANRIGPPTAAPNNTSKDNSRNDINVDGKETAPTSNTVVNESQEKVNVDDKENNNNSSNNNKSVNQNQNTKLEHYTILKPDSNNVIDHPLANEVQYQS